jgi:hypothetical protein
MDPAGLCVGELLPPVLPLGELLPLPLLLVLLLLGVLPGVLVAWAGW